VLGSEGGVRVRGLEGSLVTAGTSIFGVKGAGLGWG
jgi:hypothetical protein